jgi:hypothetical protein
MDMAAAMAHLVVGPGDLTKEQAQRFVELLAAVVDTRLQHAGDSGVWLSVDYGPCRELAEAAQGADISLSRFPWKTHSRVTTEYATASLGYRSPNVLIWSAPGWERPTCDTRRYTDDWSKPLPEACGLPLFHDEAEHGAWAPREDDE